MIETKNLVKDYGPIRAVDNVSFQVEKGDILGFLGPNGAGKSTTMKIITGFLPPTVGTASVGGYNVQEYPITAKRLLGYLPENGPLYQEMTVLEFLNFIAELRGFRKRMEKATRISAVMEICHLKEVGNQPIETLSKGYRQRVGMAQAVIHDPPYLVMDEPTDGLDPNQKQEVRRLIASMAQDKAIILSTHILDEVESMCNRVLIIAHGRMVVDEKPEDLRRRHKRFNAVKMSLKEDKIEPIKALLEKLDPVREVTQEDQALIIIPKKGQEIDRLVFEVAQDKRWPLVGMEKLPLRLEEVFWDLTQKN